MARVRKASAKPASKALSKSAGEADVAKFIEKLDHPLKGCMATIRGIILSADKGVTEHIKWNAPSFCHAGDDRVTFNLHRSGYILIVFHRGAKHKENKAGKPFFDDGSGLLKWLSDSRAIVKFHDELEVAANKAKLKKLVSRWIELTSQ